MSREKWKQERARHRLRHRYEQEVFWPVIKRAMHIIGVLLLIGMCLEIAWGLQGPQGAIASFASAVFVALPSFVLFLLAMSSMLFFTSFKAWVPKGYAPSHIPDARDAIDVTCPHQPYQ